MPRIASLILVSTLAIGLSGCEHLAKLAQWANLHLASAHAVKVTPVVTVAPARTAAAVDDALYARALAAIYQRDYGMALDVLQVERQAHPADPKVLTAMGVVYDKLGRFDLSKRYYSLAEAADPGSKVVAIDRAYSLVLQQRGAPRPTGDFIALAEAPVTRWTADARLAPPTDIAFASSSGRPFRGGVRIINATGSAGGAAHIQARLVEQGWRIGKPLGDSTAASPASRLRFPPTAARVAQRLARSLPFRLKLDPCGTCTRLELVLGTNSLPQTISAALEEAPRG